MEKLNFNASIGLSRKWDAREAGREVAESALNKLDSNPTFVLLFSTIHYKNNGGFEEFLKGVWEILPKDTPLIGGTVVGFINNFGCYTRGATALAVSYPNMDVVLAVGKNTKRNPNKAAKKCADMIKNGFDSSKYKNKFLLNFVSGPELMKIPGQGYKKVIDSGFMSKFISAAFGMSQYFFQKGVSREDEVFEKMIEELPNYDMILGTSFDDYKGINHYQFLNNQILTNSVVVLGLSTDLDLNVNTTHGMKKTDIDINITKVSRNNHMIQEINHKPAVQELHNIFNWPEGFLDEKTMLNKILYYPISPKWHNHERPTVMPFILKDSIMTSCLIEKGNTSVLRVSGNNLVNAIQNNLNSFIGLNPKFCICSSCMTILQTLGGKVEIFREEMLKYFNDTPFLMFYCAGEGTYSPKNDINYANMSFNFAIFGENIISN